MIAAAGLATAAPIQAKLVAPRLREIDNCTLQFITHLKMDSIQPATQSQKKSLLSTVTTVLSAISVARSVLPVGWFIIRCNKIGRVRRITQPDCVYTFSAYNASSSPDGNYEKIKVYLSKHSNFNAQR